jgi:hypothetical protein
MLALNWRKGRSCLRDYHYSSDVYFGGRGAKGSVSFWVSVHDNCVPHILLYYQKHNRGAPLYFLFMYLDFIITC